MGARWERRPPRGPRPCAASLQRRCVPTQRGLSPQDACLQSLGPWRRRTQRAGVAVPCAPGCALPAPPARHHHTPHRRPAAAGHTATTTTPPRLRPTCCAVGREQLRHAGLGAEQPHARLKASADNLRPGRGAAACCLLDRHPLAGEGGAAEGLDLHHAGHCHCCRGARATLGTAQAPGVGRCICSPPQVARRGAQKLEVMSLAGPLAGHGEFLRGVQSILCISLQAHQLQPGQPSGRLAASPARYHNGAQAPDAGPGAGLPVGPPGASGLPVGRQAQGGSP